MSVTVRIEPGTKGIDYANPTANPPEQRYAEGYRFVCRYIAGGAPRPKVVTRPEIDRLHAAGMAVIINWEWQTTDAMGGAERGARYGAMAKGQLEALGYPTSLAVPVSVDQGLTPSGFVLAEAYLRAFDAAVKPWPIGVYGGTPIIARMADICRFGWRAVAPSWSPPGVGAVVHIRQGYQDASHAFDPNNTLLAFDAWLPNDSDPQPPQEEDMPLTQEEIAAIVDGVVGKLPDTPTIRKVVQEELEAAGIGGGDTAAIAGAVRDEIARRPLG